MIRAGGGSNHFYIHRVGDIVNEGLAAAAKSRSSITRPMMVPHETEQGAMRAITDKTGGFRSIFVDLKFSHIVHAFLDGIDGPPIR